MARSIAAFDVDGTLYRGNMLVDLVEALIKFGTFPAYVSKIYEVVHRQWRIKRDRATYDQYMDLLVSTYLRFIKGVKVEYVLEAADYVAEQAAELQYAFGKQLLEALPNHCLVAISGAPTEVVERVTAPLGFEVFRGAWYDTADDKYTGEAIPGHTHKDQVALSVAKELGLSFDDSVGMGDTHSDATMLALMRRAIAFHPNKELLNDAIANGWEIVYERKDVILHLQGGLIRQAGKFAHYYSI